MKEGLHPKTRQIIFYDSSANKQFLLYSSVYAEKKAVYEDDGKEYPMVNIDVSSASHPVYTGKSRANAKEGRVARFKNKFGSNAFSA